MTEIFRLPLGMVNAYLLRIGQNALLVDTGSASSRQKLLEGLERAGQAPEDLRLVLLTHNHPDHSGGAAWLRKQYGLPVALHPLDTSPGPLKGQGLAGALLCAASRRAVAKTPPLLPDLALEDGQRLHAYGIPGQVLHLPGHTAGSVGLLLDGQRLLCGDLYMNLAGPHSAYAAEDFGQMRQSLEKLLTHPVDTVFPGHGRPFCLARLAQPEQGKGGFLSRFPCPKGADCANLSRNSRQNPGCEGPPR